MRRCICSFILALVCSVGAEATHAEIRQWYAELSEDLLQPLLYYSIPDTHPIKAELDAFFSKVRVTEDAQSLKEAGFTSAEGQPFSQTVVTKHPHFPGYVFKLYTDDQDKSDYIYRLKERVVGAYLVRDYITKTHTEHLFTVPQKWIYFLPPVASKYTPKACLLVAEEVKLISYAKNIKKWKSDAVAQSTLRLLFDMLQEGGLSDSIYPSNIPFTPDGKIAFIDTECVYWWPEESRLPILGEYLSPNNCTYWLSLCAGLQMAPKSLKG